MLYVDFTCRAVEVEMSALTLTDHGASDIHSAGAGHDDARLRVVRTLPRCHKSLSPGLSVTMAESAVRNTSVPCAELSEQRWRGD